MLLATIDPEIDTTSFAIAMGVLGVGLGLIASQLGNVVQSAIADPDQRGRWASTRRSSWGPRSVRH